MLYVMDLAWLAALALVPVIWLFDPLKFECGPLHFTAHWGPKPILFALLLPAVRFGFWRAARGIAGGGVSGFWQAGWYRRATLGTTAMVLFFAVCESILAAVNFKFEMPAVIFEGKDEFGGIEVSETIPDSELLYRFKPGDSFCGRKINSMGFREREVDPVKRPGSIMVICMGDSVTAQGLPGYSEYLDGMLKADPPTGRFWEAFNMAVHGYSVYQGLILFRRQVRSLDPDIVTIYFGWNDHWLNNQTDEMAMAVRVSPLVGKIFDRLRTKRIFMALHALINPVGRRARGVDGRVYRVPPQRYEALLKQLVAEIRAAGAVPVIITAPSRPLPESEVGKERIVSREQGNRVHQEYVELTRKVAGTARVPLLDLAAIFKGPECDRFFARDGIHFDQYAAEGIINRMLSPERQPGLWQVAAELNKFLRTVVAGPEWRERK